MHTHRFVIWGTACGLVVGIGAFAAYAYGGPRTRLEAINSYYGELLKRQELKGVTGPHYWKDGKVCWIGNRYLKYSEDFGTTSVESSPLPDTFNGPARFISETILADQTNVYLRQGVKFKRVLENFLCWHVCGSKLKTGDLVVGEYGSRIYTLNVKTGETHLLLEKPSGARHFHIAAVDPFTDDIYASLGDAHKSQVTGIMRSQDRGNTWQWLYKKTRDDPRDQRRQPTAVYFDKDVVYFGEDNRPQGIFIFDRKKGTFEYVFVMSSILKSYYTAIIKLKGSFWAISRSFTDPPTPSFGLLWWSEDGKNWVPIQTFKGAPYWLQADDENLISVGFLEDTTSVTAFNLPDAAKMAEWVSVGPTLTLLDQLYEELRGPVERLTGWSFRRPPSG